jgi:hypothetical protein
MRWQESILRRMSLYQARWMLSQVVVVAVVEDVVEIVGAEEDVEAEELLLQPPSGDLLASAVQLLCSVCSLPQFFRRLCLLRRRMRVTQI